MTTMEVQHNCELFCVEQWTKEAYNKSDSEIKYGQGLLTE